MARASPSIVISHWYHLLDGLQTSSLDFYAATEQAISRRKVPGARTLRVDWKEGGLFSARREYLRVRRKKLVFDICAAPFGPSFFVSWWLGELPSAILALLSSIPIAGVLFERYLRPKTYYEIDTALRFQEAIHGGVMEVVDQMSKARGLRILSVLERKPVLREFYQR
jgi:hypothetical protein